MPTESNLSKHLSRLINRKTKNEGKMSVVTDTTAGAYQVAVRIGDKYFRTEMSPGEKPTATSVNVVLGNLTG